MDTIVSLDADPYAPLLAGLEYFYPGLSPGRDDLSQYGGGGGVCHSWT